MNVSASPGIVTDFYSQMTTVRDANSQAAAPNSENRAETETSEAAADKTRGNSNAAKGPLDELNADEQRIVDDLKKRDAEVKAHERAHIAAGGPYVSGGASYEYERGPDNQNYAVGGEVSIDVSAENTPEATIRKMQVVKRAALAPKDPSGQDRSVAAQATQAEARARIELQKERSAETAEKDEANSSPEEITASTNDNRLGRQAAEAYRQTESTTNPFSATSNSSNFSASA